MMRMCGGLMLLLVLLLLQAVSEFGKRYGHHFRFLLLSAMGPPVVCTLLG